jgi:ferredoxin
MSGGDRMKVIVNRALCDGNGNCVREAPELFAMSDDDTLLVLKETFDDAYREKAEAAVQSCPKNALRLAE